MPCHVAKAKIGNIVIHHGSFHTLKGRGLINDEVMSMSLCVCSHACITIAAAIMTLAMQCQCLATFLVSI